MVGKGEMELLCIEETIKKREPELGRQSLLKKENICYCTPESKPLIIVLSKVCGYLFAGDSF